MELEFTAFEADGKQFKFKLNDSVIDYREIRKHIPESLCIEAIEKIKKESKKKCAMIFGNCQTVALKEILIRNFKFRKEYLFLNIPAVCFYDDATVDLIYGGGAVFTTSRSFYLSACKIDK